MTAYNQRSTPVSTRQCPRCHCTNDSMTEVAGDLHCLACGYVADVPMEAWDECEAQKGVLIAELETELAALKARRCEGCMMWWPTETGNYAGCPVEYERDAENTGGDTPADFACNRWTARAEMVPARGPLFGDGVWERRQDNPPGLGLINDVIPPDRVEDGEE